MGPLFIAIATQSVERDLIAAIIGLCVGSFLNVLANRTLAEQPLWSIIFGSSNCPKCQHKLGVLDLIPVLSFVLLHGKCRYCKQSISWQYPAVEIATAVAFVAVLHLYQVSPDDVMRFTDKPINAVGLDVAMISFFCILITVCVTDFKEKLIPHEITYPAILIGIAFSALGRDDLLPSLAGIGISYILFDFLAFYGLKLYYFLHRDEEDSRKLDRAIRATDKDTLATVPTARASGLDDAAGLLIATAAMPENHEQVNTSHSVIDISDRAMSTVAHHRSANQEFTADAGANAMAEPIAPGFQPSEAQGNRIEETSRRPAIFAEVDDSLSNNLVRLVVPTNGNSGDGATSDHTALVIDATGAGDISNQANVLSTNTGGAAVQVTQDISAEIAAVPVLAPLGQAGKFAESEESQEFQESEEFQDFKEFDEFDPEIDEAFNLRPVRPGDKSENQHTDPESADITAAEIDGKAEEEEEEFEVMGGGDAVLAALIAAWIGLQNLGLTLLFGFMFGSLMGSVYLCIELHSRGALKAALQKTGAAVALLVIVSELTVYLYAYNTGALASGHSEELWKLPWLAMAAASTFGGILIGTVWTGREGSKPFPFGPALAAGAMVAVFMDPTHAIHLSDTCTQFWSMLRDMGHN